MAEGEKQQRANTDEPKAWRVFGLAFLGAVVFYVIAYAAIEHWRPRNGPWEVTFETVGVSDRLVINQHRFGITNVQVSFSPLARSIPPADRQPAATATRQILRFDTPRSVPFELPFGRCIFLDTTVLPGTVTLQIHGHEIELLPRVLIVDHQEHPWKPSARIELRSP